MNIWNRLELSSQLDLNALTNARVLLIGAGGLGNDIALRLAGSKIGKLTIVDGDTVSESNIPHSTLFTPDHIGLPKVAVIQHFLQAKFPDLDIQAEPHFVQQANPMLFADHDLIICAPDNDQTRRWVNHFAVQNNKPALFIGVSGQKSAEWTGYTFLYQPYKTACFACFASGGEDSGEQFEHIPTSDDIEASRNKCGGENVAMPMLSPVVGAMAAYSASLAVKLLAHVEPTPTYTYFDLKKPSIITYDVQAVDGCASCGVEEEFEMDADFLAQLRQEES